MRIRWSQFTMFVFVCVAIVVIAATCKPQRLVDPTAVTRTDPDEEEQKQAQEEGGPERPCTNFPNLQLCEGDPCEVKLVVTDTAKEVVAVPNRVLVQDGQVVTWTAVGTAKRPANVLAVHFINPGETASGGKDVNDRKQSDPDCDEPNKCKKTIDAREFTPCTSYHYGARVKHGNEEKESDPELVVSGGGAPPPAPPQRPPVPPTPPSP